MLHFSQAIHENINIILTWKKRWLFYLMICLIMILNSVSGYCNKKDNEVGVIIASSLNIRSYPSFSGKTMMTLKRGTEVVVLSHHGGWFKISYNGKTGYGKKQYIQIIKNFIIEGKDKKSRINQIRAKTDTIKKKIKKHQETLQQYSEKEVDVINDLDSLDRSLNIKKNKSKKIKSDIRVLRHQISRTGKSVVALVKVLKKSEDHINKRLIALYKLYRTGTITFLASSDSIYEMMFRKASIERIIASDMKLFKKRTADKLRLQNLQSKLEIQQKETLSLQGLYKEQIRSIMKEKYKRSIILSNIRSTRSLKIAAIDSLNIANKNLDNKLDTINKEEKKSAIVTEEYSGKKKFSSFKGMLMIPVKGRIISRYGKNRNKDFNIVTFQSGIKIKAKRGEPVKAVYDGKVLYASWFKGYGNLMIINHGENYYTLYAYIDEVFKEKGDIIKKGDVIATVGSTGLMSGPPSLYFEIRHHGKPVNPQKWFLR